MIRFHLDEHVSHDISRGLKLRGLDVTTSTDAQLLGASDLEHLAFAATERRVIVTRDPDFLMAAASGVEHQGIVFLTSSGSIGDTVRFLCLMHDCMSDEEMLNHIEYF